jgi:LacI family transcriptional regulator
MAGAKKVSMSEVAWAAGVSKMTVSRYLNNTGIVAETTREKLRRVITDLHYRPNAMARGLASNKTSILGLMVFDHLDMDSSFFLPIFFGVEHEARFSGYDLLLFTNPRGGRESRCLGMVDGLILLGSTLGNDPIENLEGWGIPYITIGRRKWRKVIPWCCAVNYVDGFRKVTEYLIDLGHRRIAFWGGSKGFSVDVEKHLGYLQALEGAGLVPGGGMDLYEEDIGQIRDCMDRYRPTAVIMEGGKVPLPLLLYAREKGLRIPGDLSLVYTRRDFIDVHTLYDLAGIHEMTLMTVPRQELGAEGFRLLKKLIDGETGVPRETLVEMEFIIGESSGPPPGGRRVAARKTGDGEVLCGKIKNQV